MAAQASVQYDSAAARPLPTRRPRLPGWKAPARGCSPTSQAKTQMEDGGTVRRTRPDVLHAPVQLELRLGGRFACADGAVQRAMRLSSISTAATSSSRSFPRGRPGPMTANAGRRSCGAEATLHLEPRRSGGVDIAYGFTDARFVRYRTAGKNADGDPVVIDYAPGKQIPYAPGTRSRSDRVEHRHGVRAHGSATSTAGRHAGRRTHLLGRGEHPLIKFLHARRRLAAPRAHPLLAAGPLGPQPRGHPLRGVRFESMGREFAQRGRPPDLRHHVEHPYLNIP